MKLLIFPFYCYETDTTGYTHLRQSQRPNGWVPAITALTLTHDIVEHLAGPTHEIQALGSYEQVRGQWQEGSLYYDVAGAMEYGIEDLQPHHNQHDDIFGETVEKALSYIDSDTYQMWLYRYKAKLTPLLIQTLSKGWDDAIKTYGETTAGYDHFFSIVAAIRPQMDRGGTFILDTTTYETFDL